MTQRIHWDLGKKSEQEMELALNKKQTFEITISDGYCTWQYTLIPEKDGEYCIDDIMKTLWGKFKSKRFPGKLIDPEDELFQAFKAGMDDINITPVGDEFAKQMFKINLKK